MIDQRPKLVKVNKKLMKLIFVHTHLYVQAEIHGIALRKNNYTTQLKYVL